MSHLSYKHGSSPKIELKSKECIDLGMVKKQLQVFHFGNDSIIPFPQITIKNNIGNRNI